MRELMDFLCASLAEVDLLIRQQRQALATVQAIQDMDRLETARKHIRAAQIGLVSIEGDAFSAEASPPQRQTQASSPGERQP